MQRSTLKGIHKAFQKQTRFNGFLTKQITTSIHLPSNHAIKITPVNSEPWVTVISTLAQGGHCREPALYEATKLLRSGHEPNGHVLVLMVRAATDLGLESYCQQLHGYISRSGFGSDVVVSTSLVRFYGVMGSMNDAHKLFVEIPQPSVVSWNTLISGYVRSGEYTKALGLFLQLERSDAGPDAYSFTMALSACGHLSVLQFGSSIHCKIVKSGLECSIFIANCLIDMYGKCGYVGQATRVFNEMIVKDIISWNSAIAACARNQALELACNFFYQMPEPDTISYNELINGIAQFGNIKDAAEALSIMPNPNSSTWNSIITAYVNRSKPLEALHFFTKMHSSGTKMDEYTFSILLSAIAGLAALKWGMLIHSCCVKLGLDASVIIGSALIDMYSKCGQVKDAESLFVMLPKKNLVTWNAMISGYAHNGHSSKVIRLFEEVKLAKNLKPDWVTFLNVIAACSGSEVSLQKAIQYFDSMINDYGIEPSVEHCCSIIRLLGQRGEVWRAARMIHELALSSCVEVWRALLGACGACKDLKVAKVAAAKLIELEGNDDYLYVMLSNIFASYEKWEEARKVRKLMKERGVQKGVGYSWIEME
uniref:Putative pentatricopeptide repeat-containing protein At5g47460 n=1 Tax=Rhizophora mucronata TaxID=61149 RepID=A0A2P2QLA4_RHIMU